MCALVTLVQTCALPICAFAELAAVSPRARGEVLRKAYDLMVGDGERLARIITLENGKSLADARAEVAYAAEFFRWNAEEAVRIVGQMSTAPSSGARILVNHKAAGVAQIGRAHV